MENRGTIIAGTEWNLTDCYKSNILGMEILVCTVSLFGKGRQNIPQLIVDDSEKLEADRDFMLSAWETYTVVGGHIYMYCIGYLRSSTKACEIDWDRGDLKNGVGETLFNAHPTGAPEGASLLRRGYVAVRGVYAAVLEMAGDQGTVVGGAQHNHNDRYMYISTEWCKFIQRYYGPQWAKVGGWWACVCVLSLQQIALTIYGIDHIAGILYMRGA